MRCSVIVPIYNDWQKLPKLLECLDKQTLNRRDFEVILVDNASEDYSPPESLLPNARIEFCTIPGSYAARNQGIVQASGEWLVFTDADCRPNAAWLESLMAAADRSDEKTLLAGSVKMVASNQPPSRWEIYDLVRGIPQEWYVKRGYAATANLAVPAPLMARLGGFDTRRLSGGDAELCRRAIGRGAVLQYVPNAVIEHPARVSRAELLAKLRRIKAGQVASGDWLRRLRSFFPPVIEGWKLLNAVEWPLGYRLTAIAMQLSLWPVEMLEALRARPRNGFAPKAGAISQEGSGSSGAKNVRTRPSNVRRRQ